MSELHLTIDETALNIIVRQIKRQRPSLFSYATPWVAADPDRGCCQHFEVDPEVRKAGDPLFTISDPFRVPGTHQPQTTLEYCIQLCQLVFDFAPTNAIPMPEGWDNLEDNELCIMFKIHAGLERYKKLPKGLACFDVSLYARCSAKFFKTAKGEWLQFLIKEVNIESISPDGLEASLESLLNALVSEVVTPNLILSMEKLKFELKDLKKVIQLHPDFAQSPNPQISANQLNLFFEVTP